MKFAICRSHRMIHVYKKIGNVPSRSLHFFFVVNTTPFDFSCKNLFEAWQTNSLHIIFQPEWSIHVLNMFLYIFDLLNFCEHCLMRLRFVFELFRHNTNDDFRRNWMYWMEKFNMMLTKLFFVIFHFCACFDQEMSNCRGNKAE